MMNRAFGKQYIVIIVAIISFLLLPSVSTATPLEAYPRLYTTINGNSGSGLYPGFGIIESNGSVNELNRMTREESQNSYSAFGITKNSNGEYWTSTGNALVQFNENTGQVIQSLPRTGEAFFHIVYDSFDNLYGWSNGNGFLLSSRESVTRNRISLQ